MLMMRSVQARLAVVLVGWLLDPVAGARAADVVGYKKVADRE